MNKRIKTLVLSLLLAALLGMIFWIVWGNTALEISTYIVRSEHISEAFEGYRIVHISDLHNAQMGKDNRKLLEMIKEAKPDMIAITGDLIDSRNTNIDVALQFAEKAMEIAPCYYVTGNHESRIPEYDRLKKGLIQLGVVVLENATAEIWRDQRKLVVMGIDDPGFLPEEWREDSASITQKQLEDLMEDKDSFTVLLSHRPEMFEIYVKSNVDLALSGHVHGGQFRLPIVGGVVSPNRELFPKYDAGMFVKKETIMVVSRGIGNSIIPFRINNRPEVVLIELTGKG